jgi:hypothetical protein
LRDLISKKGTKIKRASQLKARKYLIKNKEELQDEKLSVIIDKYGPLQSAQWDAS